MLLRCYPPTPSNLHTSGSLSTRFVPGFLIIADYRVGHKKTPNRPDNQVDRKKNPRSRPTKKNPKPFSPKKGTLSLGFCIKKPWTTVQAVQCTCKSKSETWGRNINSTQYGDTCTVYLFIYRSDSWGKRILKIDPELDGDLQYTVYSTVNSTQYTVL